MEDLKFESFCGVVLSYGRVPRLKEAIASLGDLPVVVFNPNQSWWDEDMPDYTAEQMPPGVWKMNGDWKSETDVRNAMQEFVFRSGYQAMIMIDADEVIDDIEKMIDAIQKNLFHSVYTCDLIDHGPNGELLEQRTHHPAVAVDCRTLNAVFTDKRCVGATLYHLEDIGLHHYSYDVPEEYIFKQNKSDGDIWPPEEHRSIIE